MIWQSTLATIGHNNPPDPIETLLAEWDGTLSEAQNWTDGEPVTDKAGMDAVDIVLKEIKSYRSALTKAAKERTDPLHKVWKSEVAAVKVYTDDADLIQKALVATVAPFKEKLAAEQREVERLAWAETNRLRREAEALAAKANVADVDAQREANAARQTVIDAEKTAKKAVTAAPKGMRKVTKYETTDRKAALHDIAANHRDAMTAFIDQFVASNHKKFTIAGVRVWEEKEAF